MEGSRLEASGSQNVSPVRRHLRVFGVKVCQVCGDKALAHHFGALACETCKAFFRRNALKQDGRKCLFQGNCPVDKKTRRFCPSCRLNKCFSVGMQTDLILNEDERKERMQKIQKKQVKKQKSKTESSNTNSVCMVTTMRRDSSFSLESLSPLDIATAIAVTQSENVGMTEWDSGASEGVVKNLDCQTDGQATFRSLLLTHTANHGSASNRVKNPITSTSTQLSSSAPYSTQYLSTHTQTEEQKPEAGYLEAQRILVPFEHVTKDQLPSDPYMYWRLLEEERCLLTKLSAAYQDTVLSILNYNPPLDIMKAEDVTHEYHFHQWEVDVRNVIGFARRLEDFQKLPTNEQVALLKASTPQVLSLRSCALFVAERNAWLTEGGYFTTEHAHMLCPDHPLLGMGHSFCKVVKDIIKNDLTLYALLHCIILFDPCEERIMINRQHVNTVRDKYIILLRHYLESVYSYRHSEKYFLALQEKIHFFHGFCEEGKPLLKKLFPHMNSQLLVEVMDLE